MIQQAIAMSLLDSTSTSSIPVQAKPTVQPTLPNATAPKATPSVAPSTTTVTPPSPSSAPKVTAQIPISLDAICKWFDSKSEMEQKIVIKHLVSRRKSSTASSANSNTNSSVSKPNTAFVPPPPAANEQDEMELIQRALRESLKDSTEKK